MANILVGGTGLFFAAALVQIGLWHFFKVRREMLCLGIIFIVVPFFIFITLALFGIVNFFDTLLASLLFYSLSSVYVQVYPALREDTPSFRILFVIEAAGANGIPVLKLIEQFAQADLVSQKVSDLSQDGLVRVDESGRFSLNLAGRLLAKFFAWYRSLLGLSIGEG